MRKIKLFLILAFIFTIIPKGATEKRELVLEGIEFVKDGIKYVYRPLYSTTHCSVIAGDKPYEGDIVVPDKVMLILFQKVCLTKA